jgi:hypothetical protein
MELEKSSRHSLCPHQQRINVTVEGVEFLSYARQVLEQRICSKAVTQRAAFSPAFCHLGATLCLAVSAFVA